MKRANLVAAVFIAAVGTTPLAEAAKYHLLWKWPTGIHETLWDVDPGNIAICSQVLSNLNNVPRSHPYSWLSPPKWNSPVTAIPWVSISDSDRAAMLVAQNIADCDKGICGNGRGLSDARGQSILEADLRDKNLRIETATVVLIAGQPAKTIVRVHYTVPEPTTFELPGFNFNSEFYEVVQSEPPKLSALDDFRAYADVIRVAGNPYFYGYSDRSTDNYFRHLPEPQGLVVLGAPGFSSAAKEDYIMPICQMAFH